MADNTIRNMERESSSFCLFLFGMKPSDISRIAFLCVPGPCFCEDSASEPEHPQEGLDQELVRGEWDQRRPIPVASG